MSVTDWHSAGWVVEHKTTPEEIRDLFAVSERDLKDSEVAGISPDTQLGLDIRIIQLMLGHASIQQTQRCLNVTDEELRRGLEVSWNNKGRPLRLASGA